jgi:hypothetical protein
MKQFLETLYAFIIFGTVVKVHEKNSVDIKMLMIPKSYSFA